MANQRSSRRLKPAHLAIAAVLVLAGAVYQAARPQPVDQQAPTQTPATAPSPSATAPRPSRPTQTAGTAASPTPAATAPGDFDYYVLALSWSPDYCAANGSNDPQQCSLDKKLGFVLHGLWPQYRAGYPSDCSSETLPAAVKKDFAGLYPNDKLFSHEWSKHGTCSGLTPRAYLELTQQLKQSVAIPSAYRSPTQPFRSSADKLTSAFLAANSAFPAEAFAVSCSGSGRYLNELRVCFGKDGTPAACAADVRKDALKSCANADFLVRSVK